MTERIKSSPPSLPIRLYYILLDGAFHCKQQKTVGKIQRKIPPYTLRTWWWMAPTALYYKMVSFLFYLLMLHSGQCQRNEWEKGVDFACTLSGFMRFFILSLFNHFLFLFRSSFIVAVAESGHAQCTQIWMTAAGHSNSIHIHAGSSKRERIINNTAFNGLS